MPGILDGERMPGSVSSILLAKERGSVYLSMAQDVRMPALHRLVVPLAVGPRGRVKPGILTAPVGCST